MRLLGSFVSAVVVTGAGLAYYVHRRKTCTGASYLEIVRQLPGEMQRVSTEARRRAAEAVEKGRAAARRRDAELALQLQAAGPSPSGPVAPVPFAASAPETPAAPESEGPAASPSGSGPAAV